MTAPFITVSAGASSDVDEGVYEVVLTAISDPRPVLAQRGPKAGQEIELIDWTFAIAAGKHKDKELVVSSSKASGPKSKMYAFLTALRGGKPPAIGETFSKQDLIGRMALATVSIDEGGWPRVSNLGAIPASLLQQQFAQATGTPTQGTHLNLQPAQVPTKGDDLPF